MKRLKTKDVGKNILDLIIHRGTNETVVLSYE